MMLKIPFGKPLIGNEEKEAVMNIMKGSILVHGPIASLFENKFSNYTGAPHAISVSSCTAGMHLIYFALGYGPGDEIIVPAQTHVATAHAIELTGAKPVFVDSDEITGNIDINKIENAINSKTRAIAVVHYLGVPVDMPKVVDIAKRNNLFVLEDCALSLGAKVKNKHVGLYGDAGVFSFYPVKHITTGEGGMIILNDKKLADKLNLIKAFGVNRNHGERKTPGLYNVDMLGFNYRMSEIHASIGVEQLDKLPFFLTKRLENFNYLEFKLKKIDGISNLPQPITDDICSSHYCLALKLDDILIDKRSLIMDELGKKGVGTSIYYPHPVPRLSYYRSKYGYEDDKFVNASGISDSTIAFPVGPHLSLSDMDYIVSSIKQVWREIGV